MIGQLGEVEELAVLALAGDQLTLTDDHRFVRNLLDEAFLLGFSDVEVQRGDGAVENIQKQNRRQARPHPEWHHLPTGRELD